jgi:hypothetical protein
MSHAEVLKRKLLKQLLWRTDGFGTSLKDQAGLAKVLMRAVLKARTVLDIAF